MKNILEKFEYYSILFAAAAIILFVFTTVILRYLFNIVLSWPDELSRFLQIYIVWMGASASFSRSKVLKIDFLHLLFKNRRGIDLTADVITLAGSLVMLTANYKFTVNSYSIMETSMILGIPIWLIGLAIMLSLIFLIIKVGINIVGFFASSSEGLSNGGSE